MNYQGPEPQFGFAAPWSRCQKKYFRLHNTGRSEHLQLQRYSTLESSNSQHSSSSLQYLPCIFVVSILFFNTFSTDSGNCFIIIMSSWPPFSALLMSAKITPKEKPRDGNTRSAFALAFRDTLMMVSDRILSRNPTG